MAAHLEGKDYDEDASKEQVVAIIDEIKTRVKGMDRCSISKTQGVMGRVHKRRNGESGPAQASPLRTIIDTASDETAVPPFAC